MKFLVTNVHYGNVNIQSCEQATDFQKFGWFHHLLPEGGDMCIALLVLDKLSAKCNLDPSSVDIIVPIRGQKSNFICRLMNSKSTQPGKNKEAFTYCDAIAIVGKVVKSSS